MKRVLLFLCSLVIAATIAFFALLEMSPVHEDWRKAIASGTSDEKIAATKDAFGFEKLRLRATFGSAKAKYLLAKRDAIKGGTAGIEELKQSAEQGYIPAQLSLARLYFLGQGVEKDDAKGAGWVKRAADAGSSYAQALMGMLQIGGIGLKQDGEEAVKWLKQSHEKEAPLILQQMEGELKAFADLPPEERRAKTEAYYAHKKAEIGSVFTGLMEELKKNDSSNTDNQKEE